ncbi:MAG: hypothetical protein AABY18_01590 [Candidatus Thermoplasmatota archaeon]
MNLLRTAGVAFLALAVLAPAAAAQAPTFSFSIDGLPTQPVTPIEQTVNVEFNYKYSTKMQLQGAGGLVGNAQVTFDVQCPQDKILVSGGTTQIISVEVGTSNDYTGTVTIQLQVLREAPGLAPIQCTVSGGVGQVVATAVPASNPESKSFALTPDYLPYIEASASSKLRQGGPQKQIPFAIDVSNFGNAATKVVFSIESSPKGSWQGLLPDPALLDAPGGSQQTKQVVFNVATPYKNGWNNDEGGFTITVTPEYQYNSEKKGSPQQVTVLARVRGVYVPSIEPMVMVAAILGSALILRLTKDDEI